MEFFFFLFFLFLKMIKPQPQRSSWAVFHLVILLSALLTVAKCEPCQETGNFPGVLGGDIGSELTQVSAPQLSLDIACPNANLFCFPSTLPEFLPKKEGSELTVDGLSLVKSDKAPMQSDGDSSANITRMSDFGIFRLLGGRSISCSLNYHEGRNPLLCYRPGTSGKASLSSCLHDSSKNLKTKQVDDSIRLKFSGGSLPNVEVSPPMLEWGESFLYFPSLAFVTVMNTHKHSSLHVYEPYSTNSQFYPCNSSEILLAPGEAASVCFVFLPTSLGLSSAQLVLQTNFGGFLVRAKGFAVESPYGIQSVTLDVSSSGRWSKNISLFNPFDEALHVEEVISWTSVSMGNASNLTKTVCSINNAEDSSDVSLLNAKRWLEITNGGVGSPLVAMRPHGNWVVGPQKSETIMELDFSWDSEAKIFGGLCVQLLRSSQNNIDTVIIPLEAELTKKPGHDDHQNVISLSLDTVMPCSYSGTVFLAPLIVHNDSPHVLSIVKIGREGDNSKQFQIKYMKGLIIFPHTATQVALVSYRLPDALAFDSPEIDMSCKIVVSTNGSRNSRVEIPCKNIVSVCTREKLVYSSRRGESVNIRASSLDNNDSQASVAAEADEAILMNWKSQATVSDMSVLDEHEVVFPVIEVGHFCSEWISVKNPSPEPVLMQLILNSAEIVDECRTPERHMRASSSNTFLHNISLAPTRYGFSIAENAVTEVLVHPFDRASLGPVWFHPGSQCRWQSSALIRNNLSGVEWVSLGGFGGSLLMVLVEKSEPIRSLDFKMNLPPALNSSFLGTNEMDGKHLGCSQLLSKEVYAKNIGDLPLKVKRIEISGTHCRLDGFVVNSCEGFSLAPGESRKIVVSYQTDFSVATIHRDLELALTTGILVIPMKATLPMYMLSICKKSFLARLRKSFLTMVLVAFVLFIVSTQLRKSLVSFTVDESRDYIPKSGKSCTGNVYYHTRKPLVLHNQIQSGKLSRIIGLVRPYKEEGALVFEHSYADSKAATTPVVHENDTTLPDTQKKRSNSLAIGSSDTQETSRIGGDLRVKVGNEKGRRRRKHKKSTGVSGLFDVSSSHSGNSTPSSPLSPVSTSTHKRLWPQSPDSDQSVRVTSPFAHVSKCENSVQSEPICNQKLLEATEKPSLATTLEKPAATKKLANAPVMLPSATHSAPVSYVTCPSVISASSSPPCANARAPGSKLHARKAMKSEETRSDERFTYDIWGDHLFGLPLTGSSKNVLPMATPGIQNNSDSFFVRGPQILMNNSPQKVVSCPDHEG
ncbi:PREDICTED: uncharacterized protein LOC109189202 isoform X2 [Ipomoea nil]|uniref:uncharacterized protein LOC109189202 isoform X2 n=1 Tax=Ipomoea nil TaxID=35883 RepID=UPI0009016D2D|nr:PREDICTED: uncharacterized protein LOC109189202 isoform X2 [Ipomoea nil]